MKKNKGRKEIKNTSRYFQIVRIFFCEIIIISNWMLEINEGRKTVKEKQNFFATISENLEKVTNSF